MDPLLLQLKAESLLPDFLFPQKPVCKLDLATNKDLKCCYSAVEWQHFKLFCV